MKKFAIAFAGLAAIGFSGAAFAEEPTTGSWTTTTGPAAMSDSEMDQVTAGAPTINIHGVGPNGNNIVTPPAQSEPPTQAFSGQAVNQRCANCAP